MPARDTDALLVCSNCGEKVDEFEAEHAGWRFWSDGVGELHLFCEICSAREFAPDAKDRGTRNPSGVNVVARDMAIPTKEAT